MAQSMTEIHGDECGSYMWHKIANAPFDRDLELAVIDEDGVHAIVFPCRRILGGWVKVQTKRQVELQPTHWRDWAKQT